MEITYKDIRDRVEIIRSDAHNKQFNKDKLTKLHRDIEICNAHKTIAGQDDKLMKDIEFLLKSALMLLDYGNEDDWMFQLEAVVGLIDHPTNQV